MTELDAEALCQQLAAQMRPHVTPATALVGIYTGGLWLAERLHAELGITQALGAIDVSFYRDDYASKVCMQNRSAPKSRSTSMART